MTCVAPGKDVLHSPFLPALSAALTQDEEAIPVELRNLPEYKQLLDLKRLKKQTLREIQDDKEGVRHTGYKVTTATHWQQMSKPSVSPCLKCVVPPCGLTFCDASECKCSSLSGVGRHCWLSRNDAWRFFTLRTGFKNKQIFQFHPFF